jgi:hypothetical protein
MTHEHEDIVVLLPAQLLDLQRTRQGGLMLGTVVVEAPLAVEQGKEIG